MTSISGGVLNTTYTYDPNGNLTAGGGLAIDYTAFNKPASITRGTTTVSFDHDPEHQRFRQVNDTGSTLYLADTLASGVMAERVAGSSGSLSWNNYLIAGGELVGMVVENSTTATPTLTRYFRKDHLGSVSVITNEVGAVVERLSYDAWGKRRFPDGRDDPSGSLQSQTSRGFTGHEELDAVGLVHMNGRVYDPMIGRFGTPDPMTESPFDTQGWNRYSVLLVVLLAGKPVSTFPDAHLSATARSTSPIRRATASSADQEQSVPRRADAAPEGADPWDHHQDCGGGAVCRCLCHCGGCADIGRDRRRERSAVRRSGAQYLGRAVVLRLASRIGLRPEPCCMAGLVGRSLCRTSRLAVLDGQF